MQAAIKNTREIRREKRKTKNWNDGIYLTWRPRKSKISKMTKASQKKRWKKNEVISIFKVLIYLKKRIFRKLLAVIGDWQRAVEVMCLPQTNWLLQTCIKGWSKRSVSQISTSHDKEQEHLFSPHRWSRQLSINMTVPQQRHNP